MGCNGNGQKADERVVEDTKETDACYADDDRRPTEVNHDVVEDGKTNDVRENEDDKEPDEGKILQRMNYDISLN